MPRLLRSGEGLLSCWWVSVADVLGFATMARRPNSREADNRARAGRQGRTNGKPSTGQQVSSFLFGPSDPRISQSGVGGYRNAIIKAAQAAINKNAREIGRGIGDDAFEAAVSNIANKPLNMGNKIKGTRSTIYTSQGAFPGKGSFLQSPARTPEQALGVVKGQVTRAAKEANKSQVAATVGAKAGIKKGGKAGLAAGLATGGAAGFKLGQRAEKNKNKKRSGGGRGRK